MNVGWIISKSDSRIENERAGNNKIPPTSGRFYFVAGVPGLEPGKSVLETEVITISLHPYVWVILAERRLEG